MTLVQQCKHGVQMGSKHHDCAYIDFRVKLIPQAEKFANEKAGPRPAAMPPGVGKAALNADYDRWASLWNTLFHDFITQRVREWLETEVPRG